jgi:hypothetical protein
MYGFTCSSQRMADMPSAARVSVSVVATDAVHAIPLAGLRIENPWDRGTTSGLTATRPPRHLGSCST